VARVSIGIRLGPFWVSSSGRRRRRKAKTYTATVGNWHCHHAHRTPEAASECAARNGPRPKPSPAYLAEVERRTAELEAQRQRAIQERPIREAERQMREAQAIEADLQRLRTELENEPPAPRKQTFQATARFADGTEYSCWHEHRTKEAAVECAKRMAHEKSRELGLDKPTFRMPEG
jgi:hypothetical protein